MFVRLNSGEYILNHFRNRLEGSSTTYVDTLTAFIQKWFSEHKFHTPKMLHPIFDGLASSCGKNGQLRLTDYEAQKIIESIRAASLLNDLSFVYSLRNV